MNKIRDLEIKIRDFINHYRNNHVLVQDLVKWNILCSSLDVVGDTELAIESYKGLKTEDVGFNYLAVYGILQVLYVQQDAVLHIFQSLDISPKLVDSAILTDVMHVRGIRNKATGHPTKHGKGKQPLRHSSCLGDCRGRTTEAGRSAQDEVQREKCCVHLSRPALALL